MDCKRAFELRKRDRTARKLYENLHKFCELQRYAVLQKVSTHWKLLNSQVIFLIWNLPCLWIQKSLPETPFEFQVQKISCTHDFLQTNSKLNTLLAQFINNLQDPKYTQSSAYRKYLRDGYFIKFKFIHSTHFGLLFHPLSRSHQSLVCCRFPPWYVRIGCIT